MNTGMNTQTLSASTRNPLAFAGALLLAGGVLAGCAAGPADTTAADASVSTSTARAAVAVPGGDTDKQSNSAAATPQRKSEKTSAPDSATATPAAAEGDSDAAAINPTQISASAADTPADTSTTPRARAGATAKQSQSAGKATPDSPATATPAAAGDTTTASPVKNPEKSSDTIIESDGGSYTITAGGNIQNGRTVCVQNGDTLFLSINTGGAAGMSAEIGTATGLRLNNFAMQTEGAGGQVISYNPEAFGDGTTTPASVTRDGSSFRISGMDVQGTGDFDVTITCP